MLRSTTKEGTSLINARMARLFCNNDFAVPADVHPMITILYYFFFLSLGITHCCPVLIRGDTI